MGLEGCLLLDGQIVTTLRSPSEQPSHSGDERRFWSRRLGSKAARISHRLQREPLRFLAYCLVATSFAFMVMPWLDLTVSGMFATPEGNFPLARHPILIAIRDVNRMVPHLLLPAMGAILLVHAFSPGVKWLPHPHRALFVLGVYAIGSGLVVSLLKEVVERARPVDTTEFGGTAPYTIPWQFADACVRNCSFSSGEAGSAAALMSIVVLAPAPVRRMLFLTLLPAAITFSLLRVAFGRHFLSDVVVSWLLVAIVAILLWRWFLTHGEAIDRAVVGSGLPLTRFADRLLRVSTARQLARQARAACPPALAVAMHRALSWPRRR